MIVLDLMMPEMGGVQFLDELAAAAVIEKPFDVATVRTVVADHLRRRRRLDSTSSTQPSFGHAGALNKYIEQLP